MGKVMVIFDFDRTLIDGDSDNWVVAQMGLTNLFDQLYSTMPWNSLMNRMMEELHLQGKSVQDIGECLKKMTIHPRIISAIISAHSKGCILRVVSDANQFYIETILKQHGLMGYFTEIITNPSYVDDEGRLRIVPYHDLRSSPHGCALCPSNMCKGMILKRMQAAAEGEISSFIYLGDGGGDYCPSLNLGEVDHIMPRKNFPLWERINKNPSLIKAEVHEWTNGDELETILLRLVNMLIEGNHCACTTNQCRIMNNKIENKLSIVEVCPQDMTLS